MGEGTLKKHPLHFLIRFHFGVWEDLSSKTLRISVLGCKLRRKLLLCTSIGIGESYEVKGGVPIRR